MERQTFKVSSEVFHELVVMPMFGDTLDNNNTLSASTEEGDWSVIDSPKHKVPVIDIFGNTNVLKRRDATCKIIYSPAATLGKRFIYGEDLYAATEDCQGEFYQGSFEDWKKGDWDVFGEKVMPILFKGVAADMFTNKYFGDITRASDPNGIHSWNKFDGLFTQLTKYVDQGIIATPSAIAAGAITPANAVAVLDALYAGQSELLSDMNDEDKAFYVDKDIYDAYGDWLIVGSHNGSISYAEMQAGRQRLFYKGIEVKPKKWGGILKALNGGTKAHAALLTVRGNFIFKTDSTYGGGENRDEAVRMWYSMDDDVFRRQMYVQGGTEVIAPQLVVMAITEIN